MELITSSKELLTLLEECMERFNKHEVKPEKTEEYFFNQVKPSFERATTSIQIWKPLANDWIIKNKPKYIHVTQLDSTIEHIEQVVLQSFYRDINRQRFYNLHHSVEYVVESILEEMVSED
ncbi:DUF1798 family protein [Bacillus weihaiensis]|uniref:DUF1798 family protein n=1 Tax=Bacillus weihaiensis TaxID=1547283 RepID=UPI002357F806|nr:DUF1798 family protein [Bacillus weihaiensis]